MTNEGRKAMETSTLNPGDYILLVYGNGTQIARVTRVTPRGAVEIERGQPFRYRRADGSIGVQIGWAPSKLKRDDARVLGPLPANDARRHLPGFVKSEA